MQQPSRLFSKEEYIRDEAHSEVRHEYINGEVYAMAVRTETHNIAVRLDF
jgi:Uma2 family endonuclease